MADRAEIARDCYEAYASGRRDLIERHLAADFTFWSPYDEGIDRDTYFERCWPNADQIESYDFVRLIESGDEMIVTYEATKSDGKRIRNTEVLAFEGDQVVRTEVYFGWNV
jgi:ketosteroid isomerase-like protein